MHSEQKVYCSLPVIQKERSHIRGLDGLRGIAVIGVIFYHLLPDVFSGGFLGVSLFFVLSGYLMAVISIRDFRTGNFRFLNFYRKRVARIYPALIIVICMTAGFLRITNPETLNGIQSEVRSIFLGYNNRWQISQNASYFTRTANISPFTHLWSLAIEMQFYFIWPLLFLIYVKAGRYISKKRSAYGILILSFISVLWLELTFQPGQDVTKTQSSYKCKDNGKEGNDMNNKNMMKKFAKKCFVFSLLGALSLSMTACGTGNSGTDTSKTTAKTKSNISEVELKTDSSSEESSNQDQEKVTLIGDSVMLGAAPDIQELLPNSVIDAKESRQVVQTSAVVELLNDDGKMADTVVIALGTNGSFSSSTGQELIDEIGSDKTIYWVTTYGKTLDWQDDSNAAISKVAENNDNVYMIDWADTAAEHPEWFYGDGIHLNSEGQEAYAKLIFDSITEEEGNA